MFKVEIQQFIKTVRIMIIICLEGPEKVGKTWAINEIYNSISEDRREVIKDKEQVGEDERDFKAEILYTRNDSTKIKVAFYSMGDIAKEVIKVISNYLKDGSFDYLIIANREFKTVRDTIQLNSDNIILKEQKSFLTEVLKLLNR